LEWLEGRTLEADFSERRRNKEGGRQLWDAIDLLESAARALSVAHEQGIAHRDIKPANLFLANLGSKVTLKVLDFGIAKVVSESESLTKAFEATGRSLQAFTARYGAPEQFSRRFGATGPWTDVFALALVFVEAVIGRPALDGNDAAQLFVAASDNLQRPTLRHSGVNAGDEVEAVLRTALAVQPRERYGSAGEFWDALTAAARSAAAAGHIPPQKIRPPAASYAGTHTGPSSPISDAATVNPGAGAPSPPTELNSSTQLPVDAAKPASEARQQRKRKSSTIAIIAFGSLIAGAGATVALVGNKSESFKVSSSSASADGAAPIAPTTPKGATQTPPVGSGSAASSAIPPAKPGSVLPGLPARDIPAGNIKSGAFLTAFRMLRRQGSEGMDLQHAFSRCTELGMTLCTEAQFERACTEHPVLANAPTWTETVENNGIVVRGGDSCTARSVALETEHDPARVGLCCDRSIAMVTTNLQKPFLSSTADLILKLEKAVNQRNADAFMSLLDEKVSIDGVSRAQQGVKTLLERSFKDSPDLVVVNDTCEVSVQAHKTYKRVRRRTKVVYETAGWTAICEQTRHRESKASRGTTTYLFSSASKLKSIAEGRPAKE
jgi:serine/threonine protein kinase